MEKISDKLPEWGDIKNKLQKFVKSFWFFPAIVIFFLLVMTILGISGSSMGMIQKTLGEPVDGLIAGSPRPIRSDEWLVGTPIVIGQANNDFNVINENIGEGQDMAATFDVPYRGWSTLFRPSNWVFFVLPTENAFAFRWWFPMVVLLISVYAAVLAIFPKQKFLAILLSLFTLFSPFVQWWSLGMEFSLPLLIVALAIYFIKNYDKLNIYKKVGLSVAMGHTAVCFALIMYPPFQIPCLIFALALLVVWYMSNYKFSYIFNKKRWLWFVAPAVAAILIVFGFLAQHHEAVTLTLNTDYPGQRYVLAGGADPIYYMTWPFFYAGEAEIMNNFRSNQSEFSKFIPIGIILLPFVLYASIRNYKRRRSKVNTWLLVMSIFLCACTLAVVARMFVPFGDRLYELIGISGIPHKRLYIVIGLINIFAIATAFALPGARFENWRKLLFDKTFWLAFCNITIILGLCLYIVKLEFELVSISSVPNIPLNLQILMLSIFFGFVSASLMHNLKIVRATGLILVTLLIAVYSSRINPLQRGIAPVTENRLSQFIRSHQESRWIIGGGPAFGTIAAANGSWSLNSVLSYPPINFWQKYFSDFDPVIYNRYAHLVVNVDDEIEYRSIFNPHGDIIWMDINSCDSMIRELNIDFIVRFDDKTLECFEKYATIGINNNINVFKRKVD